MMTLHDVLPFSGDELIEFAHLELVAHPTPYDSIGFVKGALAIANEMS